MLADYADELFGKAETFRIPAFVTRLLNGDNVPLVRGQQVLKRDFVFRAVVQLEICPVRAVRRIDFRFAVFGAVALHGTAADHRLCKFEFVFSGGFDNVRKVAQNALREDVSDHQDFEFFRSAERGCEQKNGCE